MYLGLKSSLLFLLVISIDVSVDAQIPDYKQKVTALFNNNQSIDYFLYFSGRLGDVHPLNMALGISEKEVHGIYTFHDQELIFYLEGEMASDQFSLLIFDEFEERCGQVTFQLKDNSANGDWWNKDRSKSLPLKMAVGNSMIPLPDSWLKKFSGIRDGYYESMMIEKMGNNELFAQYFSSRSGFTLETQSQCLGNDCQQFELDFGTVSQPLNIRGNQAFNTLSIALNLPSGQYFKKLDFEASINYKYINSISYSYRIDIQMPDTGLGKLDNFILEKINAAADNFKKRVHAKEIAVGINPGLHLNFELLGWTEIKYLSPQFLSGMIVLVNNENFKAETIHFNFNLKEESIFDISSFLKKDLYTDSDFQDIIFEALSGQIEEEGITDEEWINNIDIKANYFNEEGITFSSEYHIEYGELKVLIPYRRLMDYGLKRNSPFQKMIKSLGL